MIIKRYVIRRFRIQDINPYSIKINDSENGSGRFVEGKILELYTFNYKKRISKIINGKKGTSTSFLYLIFPTVISDSINNNPLLVKEKFIEAITASTSIYRLSPEEDKKAIFKTLSGIYISDQGTKWKAKRIADGVMKILMQDAVKQFGYDDKLEKYFLKESSQNQDDIIKYFNVKESNKLVLESESSPKETFTIESLNSFMYNGVWYYRKLVTYI